MKMTHVLLMGLVWAMFCSHAASQQEKPAAPPKAGLFAKLEPGQRVQFLSGPTGASIRTYEREEQQEMMKDTIVEIGPDYIAIQVATSAPDADLAEVRIPVTGIQGVVSFRKP